MNEGEAPSPGLARAAAQAARHAWLALSVPAAAHGLAVAAHWQPPGALAVWLDCAYGYWFAATFIAALTGVGHVTLRAGFLRGCDLNSLERALFSFGVGSWLMQCLLIGLGALGLWNRWSAAALFALTLPLSVWSLWPRRRGDFSEGPLPGNVCAGESPPQRLALGFLSLGLVWAAPCILQSLLPNHDWDSALYHLPLGRRFIERGIGAAATDPAFVAYDFPAAIHLFYSMFQALGAESGVIPFNLLSIGGVGLGTGVLAARLGGPRAGWWAAGVCLSCNMFWELGCDARIDSILTFYFLLACHAVFAWLQNERQSDAWLPAAGMMLGLVVGAKYTGILFAVILGAPALVRLFLIHGPARRRALAALGLGVACLLAPSGWWYARNAAVLGDPFYQFVGGLKYYDAQGELRAFGPAWEEMARRRPLSDEVLAAAKEFERLAVDRGPNPSLFNVPDVFFHPSRYEVKPYHWLSPLFLLFLFLPLFRRDWIAFWLLVLPIAGYCGVALAIYFSRYAMPVFPLLAVGAALVLDSVRRSGWAWFWGLLLCALLTFNSAAEWRKSALLYPWERLTGRVSEIEWLEQVGYNGSPMAPPMIRFINEAVERGEIERNARIFMLGEGKGHLLRCSYLPDSTRECYRWLTELMNADCDHARVLESLRKQGVTHLLVDHGYFLWSLRSVPVNAEQLAFALRHFSRFTAEHAQVVHVGEMTTLFRVRLPKEDAEGSEDPTALGADQAPSPDPERSRRPAARRRGGF